MPERYLNTISQQHSRHKLAVDAAPDRDSTHSSGTLTVIDNTVDPNTGTIRLKAAFDNKEGHLWPGQFVQRGADARYANRTVVPSEAVQAGQQGSFVYVVKPDQSVEPRPVTVGQTISR